MQVNLHVHQRSRLPVSHAMHARYIDLVFEAQKNVATINVDIAMLRSSIATIIAGVSYAGYYLYSYSIEPIIRFSLE